MTSIGEMTVYNLAADLSFATKLHAKNEEYSLKHIFRYLHIYQLSISLSLSLSDCLFLSFLFFLSLSPSLQVTLNSIFLRNESLASLFVGGYAIQVSIITHRNILIIGLLTYLKNKSTYLNT